MPFELTIVTPSGEAYRGPAESIVLPGSEGDFGVLPEHERFLTPLRIGTIEIQTGSETIHAAIADGFAEVTGGQVAVLVESCDLAADIDPADAERLRGEAEQALAGVVRDEDADRYAAYENALALAHARVEATTKSG
jgi:F-type H+-transporting ATPase subunit epsilon